MRKVAHRGEVQLARVLFAVEQDVGTHPGHQLRNGRLRRSALPGGLRDLVQ